MLAMLCRPLLTPLAMDPPSSAPSLLTSLGDLSEAGWRCLSCRQTSRVILKQKIASASTLLPTPGQDDLLKKNC